MSKTVEVKYTDHMDKVEKLFSKAFDAGLEKAAIATETAAAKLAPVQTGRLRGSITYSLSNGEKSVPRGKAEAGDGIFSVPEKKHSAWIGTSVVYAPAIEYLHKSFLRKAVHSMRHKISKLIGTTITGDLK